MSFFKAEVRRSLIPRWREHKTTASLGELSSPETAVRHVELDRTFLESKISDWLENRDLGSAADLLAASAIFGPVDATTPAAQAVVRADRQDLPDLKELAASFLTTRPTAGAPALVANQAELAKQRVRRARQLLFVNPRDAVALVDMSHAYATMGLVEKSMHTMRVARSIAPASRFVLRSSARLMVHAKRPDDAHAVLHYSPSLRSDPWLLASEIALASLANKRQTSVRSAREMAENTSFTAFSRNELFAALATLEMNSGNHRSARRLFEKALVDPTDNTVAQVLWGVRENSGVIVDLQTIKTPRIFEARAQQFADAGDWQSALREMEAWSLDEPFSVKPIIAMSYIYGVCLREDLRAIEVLMRGLKANPINTSILNNLAFSLANIGQVIPATRTLTNLHGVRPRFDPANLATTGLICYRSGRAEVGRRLYDEAVSNLEQARQYRPLALARLMLAREEIRLHGAKALPFLRSAKDAVARSPRPEFTEWLDHLESLIAV